MKIVRINLIRHEPMTEHYSFVSPEEKQAAVIKLVGLFKQEAQKKSGDKSGDHA